MCAVTRDFHKGAAITQLENIIEEYKVRHFDAKNDSVRTFCRTKIEDLQTAIDTINEIDVRK